MQAYYKYITAAILILYVCASVAFWTYHLHHPRPAPSAPAPAATAQK